jgi:hypothetical protein
MLQINKNYIFKIAKKFVSQSYVTCDGYLRLLFTHVDTSKQRMSEVYYAANGQLDSKFIRSICIVVGDPVMMTGGLGSH